MAEREPEYLPTSAEIAAEARKIREENRRKEESGVVRDAPTHLKPRHSRFHGVTRYGRRWRMTAQINRRSRRTSLHDSELQAAFAYDRTLAELGLHTLTPNFPDAMPPAWRVAADVARATDGVRRRSIDRSAKEAVAAKGGVEPPKPRAKGRPIKASHGFKGVVKDGFRWRAQICLSGGETRKIGSYLDPEEAAKAYDRAVAELGPHGEKLDSPRS